MTDTKQDVSRRNFFMKFATAAVAAIWPVASFARPASIESKEIQTQPLCDIFIQLEDIELTPELKTLHGLGGLYQGVQRSYIVRGGSVAGRKLKGKMLEGGGDWTVLHRNGVGRLALHAPLLTNDGHRINVRLEGVLHASPSSVKRLRQGQSLSNTEYYLRASTSFETTSKQYAWLNQFATIGKGEFVKGGIRYKIFALK